ncbi:MAG: DNA primase [Tepidisphaeraceae bacterium]|jgi:DNA primase
MRTEAYSTFDDAKSRILQATDIVALIGQTVRLKRRGKDFVGLCPFHQEKTPSFSVSPSKQRFYCFGCEKGGSVIDFVMLRDRVEFKEALRTLAESAGIELPAFKQSKESVSERQILLEAQSAAAMFFEKFLSHPQQGEAARKYLAERGFNAEAIQRFHIGFAADAWDALLKSAAMKKFTPPQMALAGLIKPREGGDGYYDTFRNRLMFPIRDESGRVIAFGGRVMPGSNDPAKYLNSPETPLFSKSRCVFGLDLARAKIVETRTVAVVEGYTDVVMAHQFGVGNVVSVLGTALTEHHVATLRRFADRIVLLFDADRAGDNAANRALELFLSQPVEIAIASLPQGMDPDEFLLAHGADAFNQCLAQASDALAFRWKQLERNLETGNGITSRQQAVQQYLEPLAAVRGSGTIDPIRWGAILARVSRLTKISMEELNRRFRIRPGKGRPAIQAQVDDAGVPKNYAPATAPTARQRAEGFILGLLFAEPGRWHRIQQELKPSDFTDDTLRRIADLFWRHLQDEGEPVFNEFLTVLSDVQLKSIAVKWADEVSNLPEKEEYLSQSMRHIMRDREVEEREALVAKCRLTDEQPPAEKGDRSAEKDNLRKLQEKARHPDLKRVTL